MNVGVKIRDSCLSAARRRPRRAGGSEGSGCGNGGPAGCFFAERAVFCRRSDNLVVDYKKGPGDCRIFKNNSGTSLQNAVALSEISAHDKMVFVVGNEHEGASEEVLRETDVNCRIEMENYDSLNVAIATGIILHRFRI